MIPWAEFEPLFVPETQKQAEDMLMCLALGIHMALAILPDNEENSIGRASLYVGMLLALRFKMINFEALNDFLASKRQEAGKLTPEQRQELEKLWTQLQKGSGAQDSSRAPDSSI